MKNATYRVSSGREVHLCRFYIDYTFSGLVEGSPADASPSVFARTRDYVANVLQMRLEGQPEELCPG